MLEGASYSLAAHPDPALEKTVDEVIAKIAAAQQPDGYLNTYFTLAEPGKRWTNLRDMHELYCAGHLIEAAVAHYRATGKRTLLDVAVKLRRLHRPHVRPDEAPRRPGHEEIELALVKLYQATGRAEVPGPGRVLHRHARRQVAAEDLGAPTTRTIMPVRQQREIVGHAVRAMYPTAAWPTWPPTPATGSWSTRWTAVAGRVAAKDVRHRRHRRRHEGEAFGDAYELPNDRPTARRAPPSDWPFGHTAST